jgi:hypothetical protein
MLSTGLQPSGEREQRKEGLYASSPPGVWRDFPKLFDAMQSYRDLGGNLEIISEKNNRTHTKYEAESGRTSRNNQYQMSSWSVRTESEGRGFIVPFYSRRHKLTSVINRRGALQVGDRCLTSVELQSQRRRKLEM